MRQDDGVRWVLERLRLVVVVGDLRLPDWLTVRDLSELKQPIIDVLVVILTIKFVERSLASSAFDGLLYGAATAVVILALVAFTAVSKRVRDPGK